MSKKKQAKKLPSRIKYDQANPIFSCRLPRETHTRLMDDVRTLGHSFGGWVKDHLDRDDKQAKAVAETLARKRDDLGRDIKDKRRELIHLNALIAQRDKQLSVPIETRRAEIQREVDNERQSRMAALENELQMMAWSRQMDLAPLSEELEAKKEEIAELTRTIFKREIELAKIDRALANREALVSQMAEQAMEMARRQGVPAVACFSCPGYQWFRSFSSILTAMAPRTGTSENAVAKDPEHQSAPPSNDAREGEES